MVKYCRSKQTLSDHLPFHLPSQWDMQMKYRRKLQIEVNYCNTSFRIYWKTLVWLIVF